MVYRRCTKGVLLFHFFRVILIIARKAYESGVDLQAFFLWPDASLSSFHASVRTKGENIYAEKNSKTVQASWMPALNESVGIISSRIG